MEEEKFNIFENTPDLTGFFTQKKSGVFSDKRRLSSISFNQTRKQSKSLRSSFPDDFMNDIIVIPKLSTRRLSE
jgi:hypothetical protein